MIKVFNTDASYWHQEDYDLYSIYKHVARCSRVCYQSSAKDGEMPYEFLKRVILRGKDIHDITEKDYASLHLSVFEHGTVHLRVPVIDLNIADALMRNPYSRFKLVQENNNKQYYYVTTNMRVVIEHNIDIFEQYMDIDMSHANLYPQRYSVGILTDIGCSRELNRHRVHSISEESTRFCRYTANKFGNNISILKLPWIDYTDESNNIENTTYESGFYNDNEIYREDINLIEAKNTDTWNAIDWFLYGIQIANLVYSKCIELGWKAEQAREILPLNTKTQLVHTAFADDWKHFIKLRANEVSGKVHPCAKELALKIADVLNIH